MASLELASRHLSGTSLPASSFSPIVPPLPSAPFIAHRPTPLPFHRASSLISDTDTHPRISTRYARLRERQRNSTVGRNKINGSSLNSTSVKFVPSPLGEPYESYLTLYSHNLLL